ncbi:flavoprotein [Candidatus Latescibacterota bacterium]
MLKDRTIVLAVTGGIAAYKSATLVRELKRAHAGVFVIMTEHAAEFITPLTLETLSQNPVAFDLFDETNQWEAEHIVLADRADLLLVAPATANIISKAACGIADDLVSTAILTMMAGTPVIMAPAMNNRMWENPIIAQHVAALAKLGVTFVGPAEGVLADGRTGVGRMADEGDIIDAVIRLLT